MKVKVIFSLIQTQLSRSFLCMYSQAPKRVHQNCLASVTGMQHRARFINTYQPFKPALLFLLELSHMNFTIHTFI